MKYLVSILSFVILSSCLTERRFNKVLTKGLERGWLDSSVKSSNYVYVNKIDTVEIEGKIKESISEVFKDTTIYKDTCYSKKGRVIGRMVNIPKLKDKLEKSINKVVLPEIVHCLKKPIYFNQDEFVVEVSQDSLGVFNVKVQTKQITINRPNEKGFWGRYFVDVWFLYLIIGILILIIILKR
jgi:hypothetical protein